ncbi:unnamed protein product [Toxocara canis]|uniref:Mobile element protein n=1 Tax=Toxocara canis TaxID=6265 RepID=A0A183V027_TOXCA|nr:unnamed protein product [Toxocara canis]
MMNPLPTHIAHILQHLCTSWSSLKLPYAVIFALMYDDGAISETPLTALHIYSNAPPQRMQRMRKGFQRIAKQRTATLPRRPGPILSIPLTSEHTTSGPIPYAFTVVLFGA